jgi:hypothetical protein
MATVSSTIKLFDSMTRPLMNITEAIDMTLNAVEKLQTAGQKQNSMGNTFNDIRNRISTANYELEKMVEEQQRLNDAIRRGKGEATGFLGTLKGLAATYLTFQTGKKFLELTLGGAGKVQQSQLTLQGIFGNQDKAMAAFTALEQQAMRTSFGFNDMLSNMQKFTQFTKNPEKLFMGEKSLDNLAKRLFLIDPGQGLEGAGFALKEALSGDYMSLRSRFNMGRADVEDLKNAKTLDEFINKFDALLNSKGFTSETLELYEKSGPAQAEALVSNIVTAFANSGQGALNSLAPIIFKINEMFAAGNFQPLLDFIGTIATTLGIVLAGIGTGLMLLGYIGKPLAPLLILLTFAMAGYKLEIYLSKIAADRAKFSFRALWTAIQQNPIGLVIGAVAALAAMLIHWVTTTEQGRKAFTNFVNGIIGGLNWLLDMASKIPFMKDIIGDFRIKEWEFQEKKKDDMTNILEQMNKTAQDSWLPMRDDISKIKDSITMSSEDLKLMRDMAEQESIQNFITLSPTLQVTTGDIREEADINKLIASIEEYMENELIESAEGVYI